MTGSLSAFIRDDRGTTVLETLVVFLPIMTLFYANIEIIMAYYAVVSAQKAAQLAARISATESPIYIGNDMPMTNQLNPEYASNGPTCYQPIGNDACLDPHISRDNTGAVVLDSGGNPIEVDFQCDGATVASEAECDEARFTRLMCEVRRFYPSVDPNDVTIRYDYRRLGIAGGPFVPEITVRIAPRDLPIDLIGPIGFATLSGQLGNAVASSIGEDMNTPASVDGQVGWCA